MREKIKIASERDKTVITVNKIGKQIRKKTCEKRIKLAKRRDAREDNKSQKKRIKPGETKVNEANRSEKSEREEKQIEKIEIEKKIKIERDRERNKRETKRE